MPLHGKKEVIKAIDQTYEDSQLIVRATAFAMFSAIIEGTPVATGRARNNWFLTIGSPSRRVRGRLKNSKAGKKISKAFGKKAGKESSAKSFQSLNGMPNNIAGMRMFLTNNLPYVHGLEYEGRSSQAKLGWARRAIKRTRINLRRGRV